MHCPYGGYCENTGCAGGTLCVKRPPQVFAPIGWKCPDCGACINPNIATCPHCSGLGTKVTYGVGDAHKR